MNRILYETGEFQDGQVTLQDVRAEHIREVLRSKVGDSLRMGEVDGPVATGTVRVISREKVILDITTGERPPRPRLDLILALPRPKVLRRLLPQIAALGVNRLILCNASRVERFYFDTHVLKEEELRRALIEGLMQCGDTRLPTVRIVKQLKHFVEDDVEALVENRTRWLLHPGAEEDLFTAPLHHDQATVAIGPEGGWLEREREMFISRGFSCVGLGSRILRSDTATIAALGLAERRVSHGRT